MAPEELWDRQAEMACLGRLLDAAVAGEGSTAVIQGPAGIGKSELLRAAQSLADSRGCRVLSASAAELERDFGFGVTRQLLEPALADLADQDRDRVVSGAARLCLPVIGDSTHGGALDKHTAYHGLYWLIANLSELGPLLVSVDDVHWSDQPTQEMLAYVARRLDSLPVVLVVAIRTGEPTTPALDQFVLSATQSLSLEGLSPRAVGDLVEAEYGIPPGPRFVDSCVRLTAGNPFLVRELIRTVRSDAAEPTDEHAALLETLVPRSVTRAALVRIAALPEDARRVARAAAVLEPRATVRWVSSLAELSEESVATAADKLVAADILTDSRPLSFVHPLIRSSLVAEAPSGQLRTDHKRAARIMLTDEADPELAATHLAVSERMGDPWAVSVLIQAAAAATGRGAVAAGIAHLRRALEEPPENDTRFQVLFMLGTQELAAQVPDSMSHLAEAVAAAPGLIEQVLATLALTQAHLIAGDVAQARSLIDGLDGLDDVDSLPTDIRLLVDATAIGVSMNGDGPTLLDPQLETRADQLAGDTAAERLFLCQVGFLALMLNRPRESVTAIAERCLMDDGLLDLDLPDEYSVNLPASLLLYSGQARRADGLLTDLADRARRHGLVSRYMFVQGTRAMAALGFGDISLAETCASDVLELIDAETSPYLIPPLTSVLVTVALEQDRSSQAAQVVQSAVLPAHLEDAPVSVYLHLARAHVALSDHRMADALRHARKAGLVLTRVGSINPGPVQWRAALVSALLANTAPAEAHTIAIEGVELAEAFGDPRTIGRALRTLAEVDSDRREVLLGRAIDVLDGSEARLDLGYALAEYGAHLRRRGRRTHAQGTLLRALDLAATTGSQRLERLCRQELAAIGTRPRRPAQTGVGALTGSEIRVVRMAADGLTNTEIAQALFITGKTVEAHLSHAYRKLGIASRSELGVLLADQPDLGVRP